MSTAGPATPADFATPAPPEAPAAPALAEARGAREAREARVRPATPDLVTQPGPGQSPGQAPGPVTGLAATALAHALAAAERGLAVFPLSRTKLPAIRSPHHGEPAPVLCRGACGSFGHGVYDASRNPRRIRALFAAAPRATGYGIACGVPPHHLVGIDLDTKPGSGSSAALREVALRHLFGIAPTVAVLTPSGGRHLWLSGPPDAAVPNSASRLAPGVDIRGAGGYLVGPGSRAPHGVYRAAPGTAHLPPAPCPPALLRLLLPAPQQPGGHRAAAHDDGRGAGLVHFVRVAHEGQRNTRLFWAACRAHEHGMGEPLTEALVTAARHTGLTEREARATIASAARLAATRGPVYPGPRR